MLPIPAQRLSRFVIRHLLFVIPTLLLAIALLSWFAWSPGLDLRDGSHDFAHNALWMQHAWLADDAWFKAMNRESRKPLFRDPASLAKTAAQLKLHHIADLFPHLCPCEPDGSLPRVDHPQVERFLDAFAAPDFRVFPWVGGVRGESAFPDDPAWRRTFIHACNELLHRHPRLAGIHLNIEPTPDNDPAFLTLLEELGAAIPRDKLLSVAAYPPPTLWQRDPNVHWSDAYAKQVAQRVNHVAVMLYDTGLHNPKLYRHLVDTWTTECLADYRHTELLLGVPAYNDPEPWHDPAVENLQNSLAGIHAALSAQPTRTGNYRGIALYAEWDMSPDKWAELHTLFLNTPPPPATEEGPTTLPENPFNFTPPTSEP
ncbi:MAG: glycoside hydrolase family 18 protein [Phycisphaerae bacterium]